MDLRPMGIGFPMFTTMEEEEETIDFSEEYEEKSMGYHPSRNYSRRARALLSTPADVKEYPNAYVFIIDMPGLKSNEIKVQIEDKKLLTIRAKRTRGEEEKNEEKEGVKYLKMERRIGKFLRKFVLPDNANTDAISAVCRDGVLSVTVEKSVPPEPKQPKNIEVKVAQV